MIGVEAFKLKAILFDIDDTLIPTTLYTARARKQAIDEMVDMMNVDGFKITHKKVQKTFKQVLQEFGPDHKHHFESLVEKLKIPDEMKSKYAAMAVEGYRQLRSSLKPYPQVTSTLLGLRRQGYGLYGVSKGKGIHQWGKLMSSNLTLMLDNSFITQDYGFNEKGESFYRRILEKLSLEGKYCLMVGDNVENDIIPARKCGIHTARVLMGKYKKGNGKDEEDAEYKIQKVKDLLKIVPRLESQENGRLKSQIDFLVK